MHWPAKSCGLSVIEQVWALIKKWLNDLENPPKIQKELEEKVDEAFKLKIRPEIGRKLLDSMAKRLDYCIANDGARINY